MEKIILLGGGGHCKIVIDAVLLQKKYKISGIIDIKEKVGGRVLGVPIVGSDSELKSYFKKGTKHCFVAVAGVGDSSLRVRLLNLAKKIGFTFPNIIHPSATVSKFAQLGEGNYIAAGTLINAGARIGNNCIVNSAAIIDHDCKIGDFVHIAPGAVLNGGVNIGRASHIGTGVSIIQFISVGRNSIIGAGSVVLKDIGDNIVAYGSPCKKIKNNA